tara:strand:- start:2410 stop:3075 length:666 start_codon:yes stop_codon:yes gene_type:complete
MKSALSFSFDTLAVKGRQSEERLLLGQVAQTEGWATLVGNLPTSQIPDDLDYGSMGGCPVPLRSSVVRVVFFKLVATGALATLVAAASDSRKVWFPCALSAVVNLVAAIHYMLIWKIRAQNMPLSHMHWASARTAKGTFVGNLDDDADQKRLEATRMFAQEFTVDGLRYARPGLSLFAQNVVDCILTICVPCDPDTLTGRYATQKPKRFPLHTPSSHARTR